MNVTCIDPLTDPLWQRLVDQYKSDVFHSPAWLQVLSETYGWEAGAYVLLDHEGQPRAGIPFYRIADIIGQRIVSLPFSDYCDPLVSDGDQWNCLIERLLLERCPVAVRCLHNSIPLADERFTTAKQAKWHGLDLQPSLDTLWNRLNSKLKWSIKKAQREGVVVRIAEDKETLRAFFELHLRMRKYKYDLLAQPYRFFENIWRYFIESQKNRLLIAYYGGEIIGGALFLEWKDSLYYKFNASVPAQLSHRPNDLLIWEGIQYGKAKGCTRLDFGLSDWDQERLVQYKRKFGTEEKVISFLRYMPDGASTQHEQQIRAVLTQLTDLFTDESVPDSVTDKAGEVLYRFFT
jgi:CelD/BcsL family acetyltransferase involved in cellulose biosynthesis